MVSDQVIDSLRFRPPVIIMLIDGAFFSELLESFRDPKQPLRIVIRQRLEQYGINNAEDRRVRADAQAESQRGYECETRVSHQHPRAVPQILNECIDESDSTHLVSCLLQQGDISKLAASRPGGLSFGHPLANISLGEQPQVRLNFIIEFLVCFTTSEQSPNPCHEGAKIIDHLYS